MSVTVNPRAFDGLVTYVEVKLCLVFRIQYDPYLVCKIW
jgi:hypothetical protein